MKAAIWQFLRFCIVGTAGFMVDIAVLYALHFSGLDWYSARLLSFLAAATATWLGNRHFTFSGGHARKKTEWLSYVAAMGLGGLINYAVYAVLIFNIEWFELNAWLAVAAGTAAGLLVNFLMAKKILQPDPI